MEKEKAIPFPESETVLRIKAERKNRGKTYREYLHESYGKDRARRMLNKQAS